MASLKDVRDILGDTLLPSSLPATKTPTNSIPANFQLAIPPTRISRVRSGETATIGAQGGVGSGQGGSTSGVDPQSGPSQTGPSHHQPLLTRSDPPVPKPRSLKQNPSLRPRSNQPSISRELYALIGDSAPSLRLVREELGIGSAGGRDGVGWKGKGKVVGKAENVKWILQAFTPPHHPSLTPPSHLPRPLTVPTSTLQPQPHPLILHHYRPSSSITGGIVRASASSGQEQWEKDLAAFGRDGEGRGVMEYTGWEYERWLADPSWTPLETAYLFSLLRSYDLRFLIVADRYAFLPPGGSDPSSQATAVWPPPSVMAKKQKERAEGVRKSTRGKGAGTEADAEMTKEPEAEAPAQPAQPILAAAATIAQARERRATRSIANLKDVGGAGAGGGEGSGAASPVRGSRHGTPAIDSREKEKEKEKERERERTGKVKEAEKTVKSDVKVRTLEEIKHRYYWICRKLIEKRPAADEAVRQRHMRMYDFDYDREVARKKAANALFHLNKSEIQEQESLYVELKKMEQNERRYKVEREELMRRMAGIESGLFGGVGEGQGNGAFGDGKSVGIGMARGEDGVMVPQDKAKKRKRGEDGEPAFVPEPDPAPVVKKRQDPMFDDRNNIYRIPTARDLPSRALHQPAHLRSTRLPLPKSGGTTSQKVLELMTELDVPSTRLIMPTRGNVDKLERLMTASGDLVDMKRMWDRLDQEVKVLGALAAGGAGSGAGAGAGSPAFLMAVPAVPSLLVRAERSQSVLSSATSEGPTRKKR